MLELLNKDFKITSTNMLKNLEEHEMNQEAENFNREMEMLKENQWTFYNGKLGVWNEEFVVWA